VGGRTNCKDEVAGSIPAEAHQRSRQVRPDTTPGPLLFQGWVSGRHAIFVPSSWLVAKEPVEFQRYPTTVEDHYDDPDPPPAPPPTPAPKPTPDSRSETTVGPWPVKTLAQARELQDSVDAGHQPWRLSAESVALAYTRGEFSGASAWGPPPGRRHLRLICFIRELYPVATAQT
jgi:hypothetical protein